MTSLAQLDTHAALMVIDMWNGFRGETWGLGRAGAIMERQHGIIDRVDHLVSSWRRAGIQILWSKQVHFENDITRRESRIPRDADVRNLYLQPG